MSIRKLLLLALGAAGAVIAGSASAALTPFQTFVGTVGSSSDGFGSTSQSGTISASVPVGSTVLAAYLYTGYFGGGSGIGGTLNGNTVTYGPLVPNNTACCSIGSAKADVTSIIKPLIDGGLGGIYNFTVTEASSGQDGEALVVVYSNPTLPVATFGILDGFASVTGDTTSINFAKPLNPSDPGFFAEMFLGINFSCCSQKSTVTVNGVTITLNAGNNDDGLGSISNGQLITVGGFDDPYSSLLPSYENDHEKYNLLGQINNGDTSITVNTSNASQDDNIFLAGFFVKGEAGVNAPPPNPNPVPEPGILGLLGLGSLSIIYLRRRRN